MSGGPLAPIEVDLQVSGAAVGVVHARGVRAGPAPRALVEALDAAAARAGEREAGGVLAAVRALLRHGRYRPSGRAKPASEYLLREAREGRLPRVNALVDLNTLVSLESGLPASILDLGRAGTRRFAVRRGRAGETYAFNAAGQRVDLEDLLVVATLPDDRPCANPVKDSTATKIVDETTEVLGLVYAPVGLQSVVDAAVGRFAQGLREWAAADAVEAWVVAR